MKKLRLIIRIATIILLAITIVGIVLLVISENDAVNTSYEIIAFSLGAAGMIISILAQVDSYQQEKISKQMIADLTDLNRAADDDDKVDARFQSKLDEILATNKKIYRKLSAKTPKSK